MLSLILSSHCEVSNINVLFPPLQDPNEARFNPTFRGARSDLAVWIDEYFLGFPTMPAAIAGLGINGIDSANGKLIKQRAAEAEEQRLEVAGESSEGGRRA